MAKEVEFECWAIERGDGTLVTFPGSPKPMTTTEERIEGLIAALQHEEDYLSLKPVRVLVRVSVIGEGEK